MRSSFNIMYPMSRRLPRFSRFLRTFSDLAPSIHYKIEENSLDKLRKLKENELKKKFSWSSLCQFIENIDGPNLEVAENLEKLLGDVKELMGDDEVMEVVEDATIFVLKLFMNESAMLMKHAMNLKKLFGPISFQQSSRLFEMVSKIVKLLSDDCKESIQELWQSTDSMVSKKTKLFNSDVTIDCDQDWAPPNLNFLSTLNAKSNDVFNSFSMKYNTRTEVNSAPNQAMLRRHDLKYSKEWLANEIRKSFQGQTPTDMSMEDFIVSVSATLESNHSNDELQNELFDLIGFDHFELVSCLLEHRNDIVNNCKVEEYECNQMNVALNNRVDHFPNSKPPSQFTFQTKEEITAAKLQMKEAKKLSKLLSKKEVDEVVLFSKKRHTKEIRGEAFSASTVAFREKFARPTAEVIYPNVYDSLAKAKQSSGYVAGKQMTLPEGVTRKDNKTYEEVSIPVSEPPPLNVGSKLVSIASLDEVGQQAFAGVQNLNRIQSIVFQTAYHTNENLLICAPTGAGKTNVALLTIVSTIRNFIRAEKININEFKIVYVAPMKALAAEMTANFSKKLKGLNITVQELTGDMQLTKAEISKTQMLVTTPEKWDVVTRKGTGDIALTSIVKLLIIDEVHLLHGDRGPVVEALVARTLRQVETSQSMIRIVGLSATLPNYIDVARFLRVNPMVGLFYFDARFRPVPLSQTFVGLKATRPLQQKNDMDYICYEKVVQELQNGHQVMVFVHARNNTVKTANVLKELAQQKNQLHLFVPEQCSSIGTAQRAMEKSRSKQLAELFQSGISVHHAGLLRSDRSLVEKYFAEGYIKVLVCTATLAWGVNLPAHAVIIKGTELYDAKHGSFVDLGILDVLQIFGRAGRPQFDKSGHGIIITSYDKLNHYLSLLTNQFPIESNFISYLADNLNAEVALNTVTNIEEAIEWLSYTYLFVRMRKNPLHYGLNYEDVESDPMLLIKRGELIECAAKQLDKARMIRYSPRTRDLCSLDHGRIASHFYIKCDSVEIFNDLMRDVMDEAQILAMIAQSSEFEQLKVRDEELDELDTLVHQNCEYPVSGGSENLHGKVNILLQTFLSRGRVNAFSLISDLAYITQNAVRISRALFEMQLKKNNAIMAGRFLELSLMLEHQMWNFETPLKQFSVLTPELLSKLQDKDLSVLRLREMDAREIGIMVHHNNKGALIKKCAMELPMVEMEYSLQPITRNVLRVRLSVIPNFTWNDKVHGKYSEPFWIWIEDPDSNFIYHSEHFLLMRKQVTKKEVVELVITIPINDPFPTQYIARAVSDVWLGSETTISLTFKHLILPQIHPPHTDLLELQPLPTTALKNQKFQDLYKFSHFNPIQTQIFHCLYHTDSNVLLGAPTGSGKTIAAEIAMFRVFTEYPGCKVVYIAPLKALVRERIDDWKVRLEARLGYQVIELTGDVTPDARAISSASVIVSTPEKWDGVSRSWQTRNYVREVALIVIDEIHLLGEDRGPILEVIVSRTNFISHHINRTLRIVGLSTALANAKDLANWLSIGEFIFDNADFNSQILDEMNTFHAMGGVMRITPQSSVHPDQMGLYNFRPSVRPVPLEVHITGFPGKHYCPRMFTMNKPAFRAIRYHSPAQPVLIFVASRRQTRLTALDLIAFLASEDNPKQWMHTTEEEMDQIVETIKDSNLKLTLAFGIGLHHAGLIERDRRVVEELFINQKIQVIIATATLAWGVNLPAHLVIVKGTEYFDGKQKRYVDMPITDVLQMIGRAGRPQYDTQAVACVMVHDIKKNFYKKFLYDPFPVESSLLAVLPDHINAEIVAGTIKSRQEALDYLTWTYFFRRLLQNPTYYGLECLDPSMINLFLSQLVEKCMKMLCEAYCIVLDEDNRSLFSTSLGRIASFYYISHKTMLHLRESLLPTSTDVQLLEIIAFVHEFSELPVRHNEDILNGELAKSCPLSVDGMMLDSPHTKTFLLFQAHFSRIPLPSADYFTDLKSVLDQSIRVIQAMIDVSGEQGWLVTTLRLQIIMQMIIQARWRTDSPISTVPHLEPQDVNLFLNETPAAVCTLPGLRDVASKQFELVANILRKELNEQEIGEVCTVLLNLPVLQVEIYLCGRWPNNEPNSQEHHAWLYLPSADAMLLLSYISTYLTFIHRIKSRN
ncbi:activating signal cointegrator 1 complex subunit 3 isoform X4 [Bemisia tabaci]|uniref:activating signal cointegrator 1 complex subunit 3 isoform X4 n=1 Tax=Bemisia tabaci TaxID=7038 RepID=UPI003B287A20